MKKTSLPFFLRSLTTLVTAMANMARENPQQLLRKVLEKLRQGGFPGSKVLGRFLAVSDVNVYDRLENRGHLTAAIDSQGVGEFPRKRLKEKRAQLVTEIRPGIPRLEEKKPCVLFVLTNSLPFTNSGYTQRSHRILSSLQDSGLDVSAVTRLAYPIVVGKLAISGEQIVDGIRYRRLMPIVYPSQLAMREDTAVQLVVDTARAQKATILHTTTDFKNAIVTSRAAEILGIPWIYEVRGELENTWLSRFPKELEQEARESEFYRLAREQETSAMRAASAVVAISEISAREIVGRGVSSEKVTVVPNAISREIFDHRFDKHKIREELNLPAGFLIGCITSVVGYEGLDDLIRAMLYVKNATLLIVGDGTARPQLERQVQELNLGNKVIFAGKQPPSSIWKWYAAVDLFAVPRKDSLVTRVVTPIKSLAAQALGIPVLASDLPALREVTGGLETYVRPSCPKAFALAVEQIQNSPTDGELINRRIQWAETRTWDRNAQALRELYDRLVR